MAETTGIAAPAGAAARRRRRRRRVGRVIGIVVAAAVLVYGAVLLGLGISGLHNEHALAASGVPAVAQVSATHGYGRDTIQVTFVAGARTVQGTINVGGRSYLTGQPVPVVYDPTNPTVVGLAGDIGNTSSAWAEIVVGAVFVALIPVCFLLSLLTARRRHRRAVRAVLGD